MKEEGDFVMLFVCFHQASSAWWLAGLRDGWPREHPRPLIGSSVPYSPDAIFWKHHQIMAANAFLMNAFKMQETITK